MALGGVRGIGVNMIKIQNMKLLEIHFKTHQSTLKYFEDSALVTILNIHPGFSYSCKNKQAHHMKLAFIFFQRKC